jgi:hypothetical protein
MVPSLKDASVVDSKNNGEKDPNSEKINKYLYINLLVIFKLKIK